jgi:hypothetical protein
MYPSPDPRVSRGATLPMVGFLGLAANPTWPLYGGSKGKVFFFEKKKQKTFANSALAIPERLRPGFKSFLVLFFKKYPDSVIGRI